jgi:hypothetical protein
MKNKLKKHGKIMQVKSNDAEYKVNLFFLRATILKNEKKLIAV